MVLSVTADRFFFSVEVVEVTHSHTYLSSEWRLEVGIPVTYTSDKNTKICRVFSSICFQPWEKLWRHKVYGNMVQDCEADVNASKWSEFQDFQIHTSYSSWFSWEWFTCMHYYLNLKSFSILSIEPNEGTSYFAFHKHEKIKVRAFTSFTSSLDCIYKMYLRIFLIACDI